MTNLEYEDGGQSAFPIHKQTSLFQGSLRKVNTLVKSLFLPPQTTLDLEYQDGGEEVQNFITEITAMRDRGLFMSVGLAANDKRQPELLEIEVLEYCPL